DDPANTETCRFQVECADRYRLRATHKILRNRRLLSRITDRPRLRGEVEWCCVVHLAGAGPLMKDDDLGHRSCASHFVPERPYSSCEVQKRRTSVWNASGRSMLLTWPALGITASSAPGIDARNCSATSSGERRSPSPQMRNVGTRMPGSRWRVSLS